VSKTFIIAEAGANHNRDFEQAKSLIDVAAKSGVDAVKFQTYSAETLYSANTPDFAGYKNINKLIKDIEMPRSWLKDLKSYCVDKGIEFVSTPFDEQAVEELYNIGVNRYKIAGFEATDPRIVKCVASTGLPLIITSGIGSNVPVVRRILGWVREANPSADITILHGNNAYPTPFEDAGLNQIDRLREEFTDISVGLSDHTPGILVPPLAVAKGATVIEKHYTLSRLLPGPDHPFAIEPQELEQMVKNIRIAEMACSEKQGELTASEESFSMAMRSLVTKRKIHAGEKLTEENTTTKRPFLPDSIPAREYYTILEDDTRVLKDLDEDHIVQWNEISSARKSNA
jgi:sialic acid synthase SpsE